MKYTNSVLILVLILVSACTTTIPYEQKSIYKTKFDDAVPVLNIGTFHMGHTDDYLSTEFDENNTENQLNLKGLAKLLAKFKPTILVVETLPKNDSLWLKHYLDYVQDPGIKFKNPNEIQLLVFEVGRLSQAKKLYGIDYKEGYNFMIGEELQNKVDEFTEDRYAELYEENEKRNPEEGLSLLNQFKLINHPDYLEALINFNADILTYISTKGHSEGADEAAKFYHRNLVMFSNLNQIPITKDDRIFILLGGTHTAFFNDFIKRSPKYRLVNPFDYLK